MGIRQEAERLNYSTLDALDKISEKLDKTARIIEEYDDPVDMIAVDIFMLAAEIKNITEKFTEGGGD